MGTQKTARNHKNLGQSNPLQSNNQYEDKVDLHQIPNQPYNSQV